MNTKEQKLEAFSRLLDIMDELREKCPWDKKQTIESIRHLTIEECFELSDAIVNNDLKEIKKELGDLLLHIVFYSRIASESNTFDVADVINSLCEKLITRHPHIYGNVNVENEEDVKANWEQIKLKEKDGNKTVLSGVPKSLPALIKSIRIQEKARAVGFDWDKPEDVWNKVLEEIHEFKVEAEVENNQLKTEAEFGDVLFALVNYARFVGVNPEDALEKTNKKFIARFNYVEKESKLAGKELNKMSLSEMDVYWNEAKQKGL